MPPRSGRARDAGVDYDFWALNGVSGPVGQCLENPTLSFDGLTVGFEHRINSGVIVAAVGHKGLAQLPARADNAGSATGTVHDLRLAFGAILLFDSDAPNYVPGDTNGVSDVFLWGVGHTSAPRSDNASR